MNEELLEVLAACTGLVCLVGAGGKKTTLYRLAGAHPGRVGITSTVHIARFPADLDAREIIADESLTAVVEAAATSRRVAFARPSRKPHRLAGVEPDQIARIHTAAGFQVTLIKADGARSRWIKAPKTDEPQLPSGTTTVIPVVSARAIGRPLSEAIAHRVEQVMAVTGARLNEVITPEHIARLLASEQGALQGVGDANVVPLINMVDDPERETLAREAAERALSLTARFERVVLASMRRPDNPLVDVITR
jgi:probable selenium-dependent hydroxylase accessory protein YqeC